MSDIFFNDKSNPPTEKDLADVLGKNLKHWKTVKEYVSNKYEPVTEEWKFYGKNYGWQLKTFLKKRNLFFLIPQKLCFRIVFIFGDAAVKEIEQSTISQNLIDELLGTKKYAEGRGMSIVIKNTKHISDIKKLVEIKINN